MTAVRRRFKNELFGEFCVCERKREMRLMNLEKENKKKEGLGCVWNFLKTTQKKLD